MENDKQIQANVISELKWDPFITASDIGVTVKNGVVTLSGHVDSYAKKMAAENAVKRVAGVRALAEDIQIGVSPLFQRTDGEIAQAVLDALRWNTAVKEDRISIKVEDGEVTLDGEVEWEYQRTSALRAIENIEGVRAVLNLVTVKPMIKGTDIEQQINAAMLRSAGLDASNIRVEVGETRVTLRGKVRSFAEKMLAQRTAWAAPGVSDVDNQLQIESAAGSISELIPEFSSKAN